LAFPARFARGSSGGARGEQRAALPDDQVDHRGGQNAFEACMAFTHSGKTRSCPEV
jgi:hypothetical protein